MVNFRKYLEEATQKKQKTKIEENTEDQSQGEEKTESQNQAKGPKISKPVEDISFEDFNTNDPHSVDGIMGKSFNGNIALLHKNRFSIEAKKIKEYFSSQNSPIKNDGELVFLTIESEQVSREGRNPIIINAINPKTSRTMAQNFFKKIRSHAETDLFAGLYSVLKNQGVFEKPVKKLLKFYLPEHLLDESEEGNQALDKIRETLLKESIDTVYPRVKEEDDGSNAYLNYMKKDFSLFSYLVIYHILAKTKTARLRQYTEEVMGIPSGERGYSAPRTPPFFANRPKTNKDEITLSVSSADSKENVKNAKEAEKTEDRKSQKEYDDNDEYDDENEDDSDNKNEYNELVQRKEYRKIPIEEIRKEATELNDLSNIIKSGKIIDSFINGSAIKLGERELNIFKSSMDKIDSELEEFKTVYTKKDRKEDIRKIRSVKMAGGKLGSAYVSTKTDSGLEKLAKRTRLEEASIVNRNISDKRSAGENIPKEIRALGHGKFSSIQNEMLKVKKDIKNILDKKNKTIVKEDIFRMAEKAKGSVLESARSISYFYNIEIQKKIKTLNKKMQIFEDPYKVIKKFDEANFAISLGRYLNLVKADISSLVDNLNTLLDDYKEIISIIYYKVGKEKKDKEDIMANPAGYGKLERIARDRTFKEISKREEKLKKKQNKEQKQDKDEEAEKAENAKRTETAKKNINIIKNLSERLREKTEKRKNDIAKIEAEISRMTKEALQGVKSNTQDKKDKEQDPKMASLYFKEDVQDISKISNTLFEPFKQANDNIVIFTNKASNSKEIEEINDSLERVKRILSSTNRPSIIIPSYTNKIISNIETITDKIETALDSSKASPEIIINICKNLNMLINFLDNASLGFKNKMIEEIRRNNGRLGQEEQEQEQIPQGVKPAITTKKIDDKNNKGEDENDEEIEETPPEKKNLLALAKEKLKAGK